MSFQQMISPTCFVGKAISHGLILVLFLMLASCNRGAVRPGEGQVNAATPYQIASPATPAEYYVSPDGSEDGEGSLSNPINLTTALSRAAPGVTIYLRGGTYRTGATFGTSADTWNISRSGSPTAQITILAYPGEKPIIKGHVRISGSYQRIAGLIFEGGLSRDPGSANERREVQVAIKDCHHIIFEENEVRNNDYHAGIYLSGVNNIEVVRSYIHDNGRFSLTQDPVSGSSTYNVDHGLYWGSTNGGGNVISNSVFEHNRGYGIQLYPSASDIEVRQNTMVGNGNSGLVISSGSDRIKVTNNVSAYNERNKQIRVQSGSSNLVTTNLVWSVSSNLAGIENTVASKVSGTIVADPRFVDRLNHNYHLQGNSPAIGAGRSLSSVVNDYDGVRRPAGHGYDLGAFQKQRR
jgi:hypothetical protein